MYEGTTLGRQELLAEIVEQVEGARGRLPCATTVASPQMEMQPDEEEDGSLTYHQRLKLPEFTRKVIGLDPSLGGTAGIVVCGGTNATGHGHPGPQQEGSTLRVGEDRGRCLLGGAGSPSSLRPTATHPGDHRHHSLGPCERRRPRRPAVRIIPVKLEGKAASWPGRDDLGAAQGRHLRSAPGPGDPTVHVDPTRSAGLQRLVA